MSDSASIVPHMAIFTPHVLIVTLLQVEAMLCAATPQGKELSLIAVAQHNHYIYCVIALKGDLEVLCLPSDLYTCLVGKCNCGLAQPHAKAGITVHCFALCLCFSEKLHINHFLATSNVFAGLKRTKPKSLFSALPSTLPSDALSVAVQSTGEAATAEMVHAINRPGEKEGDPGHDDASVGSSATFLQLSPMEGPQDSLQEVAAQHTALYCLMVNVHVAFAHTSKLHTEPTHLLSADNVKI